MFKIAIAAAVVALSSAAALAQGLPNVKGTVQKVDAAAEKLSIEHDAIPNLSMDPMTMVFRVADKAMLTRVKAGDLVTFNADRVNGQITVTRIEKSK